MPGNIDELLTQIKQMIAEGQSKEEIISTLVDLGYSREEAESAYLMVFKEYFADFQNTLRGLAIEAISDPHIQRKMINKIEAELLKQLKEDLEEFKGKLYNDMMKEVRAYSDAVAQLEDKVDSMRSTIDSLKLDVHEIKISGGVQKSNLLSTIIFGGLIFLGIIILGISLLDIVGGNVKPIVDGYKIVIGISLVLAGVYGLSG